MRHIEHHDIGAATDIERADAPSEGPCAAGERALVERASGRFTYAPRQHVARTVLQALAVFELPQLCQRIDVDVRIRADAEGSAGRQEIDAFENAVAEIGLGDRAQSRHRTGPHEVMSLVRREMRGVNQAPARVDRRMIEQPFDRAPARPGNAILDLLHLFGDVDVDRALRHGREHLRERFGRHGAQAMRRGADDGIVEIPHALARGFDEPQIALDIVDEAALSLVRRGAPEAALTAATQEYLVTLRNLMSSEQPATVSGLARRLQVSPQAASEMIQRLRSEGLVGQGRDRTLTLTRQGRGLADDIFRRHALMEWLLSGVIGMGWAESDHEAHLLQGAISEQLETQLDAFLGHPETCPHGNPIDLATARRRPAGTPLSEFASGSEATIYRITEEAEEDEGLLSYLDARGLRPGAVVTVRASSDVVDAITVDGPRGAATLGVRPASLIRALPGRADASLFHRLPDVTGHPTSQATLMEKRKPA